MTDYVNNRYRFCPKHQLKRFRSWTWEVSEPNEDGFRHYKRDEIKCYEVFILFYLLTSFLKSQNSDMDNDHNQDDEYIFQLNLSNNNPQIGETWCIAKYVDGGFFRERIDTMIYSLVKSHSLKYIYRLIDPAFQDDKMILTQSWQGAVYTPTGWQLIDISRFFEALKYSMRHTTYDKYVHDSINIESFFSKFFKNWKATDFEINFKNES